MSRFVAQLKICISSTQTQLFFKPSITASSHTVKASQIINLLLRIITEITMVTTQLKSTIISRQEKLQSKELRSRQRDNTKRLILSLPIFHISTHFITILCFYHLYKLDVYSTQKLSSLQRCLKSTLQFSENQRTYTGCDKNKWNEAMDLCRKNVIKLCVFMSDFIVDISCIK